MKPIGIPEASVTINLCCRTS